MTKYSADIQMARFDEDGLAIVSGWVAVYRCHPETREYIGADMDSVSRGFSVAANAYLDAPELPDTHDVAICRRVDEKSWRHVPDYRGKTAYATDTGQPINITAIGALPDNLTLQSPQTPFDKRENKQWVTDKSALKSHQTEQAEQQKIARQQQADAAIKPLQDAIDLDIATDAEKSALVEWKKYRVRVNRVDLSTAPISTGLSNPRDELATENNAHLSEYDGDALRDVVRPSVRIRYRAESGQRSLPESGKRHQLSGK